MENLGSLAVLLALCAAIYAAGASVVGRIKRRPLLVASARRAVYAVWALLTLASGIVVYALLVGDFRFAYVTQHSNSAMPAIYKFTAWWGGQEGSLLLWSWLLATYSAVVVFTSRRKHRDFMPYVVGVLMTVQTFFLILNNFIATPFKMLALDGRLVAMKDGNGLSPLLQYPAMAIHPPMLYLGYVGFSVPFAFAIGSLITRQPGDSWIHTTRRWTLVTWLFQSTGIMLGMAWAYHVLGWGGYWGWDPVENASLLPWLSGTAFLHSVMMQEKKGMMKVWNIVLVSATFFLCILGTFLTRSGVVQSVHAFARSDIGKYFVGFMAIGIAATVYLILERLDYLKSEARLESVVSRESSFLFNNLILLASCFAVLWGTLFPVISEALTGSQVTLDANNGSWYNRLMVPIGLFLLFLTGVGPLFSWRRTSVDGLRRNFQWPGLAAVILVGALIAAGIRHFYALISFGFCLFVALTVAVEFYKGSRSISRGKGMNFLRAAVELTHRNTRRYGGYLVHVGIVLMFIGFTGRAFEQKDVKELSKGDSMRIGHYELRMADLTQGETDVYQWSRASIDVFKDGRSLGALHPEKRLYKASRENTSEVGLRAGLLQDVYLNFGGMSDDNQRAVIQAHINPLVTWVWIGGLVLIGGTLVCLVPSKIKPGTVRAQVVVRTSREAQLAR